MVSLSLLLKISLEILEWPVLHGELLLAWHLHLPNASTRHYRVADTCSGLLKNDRYSRSRNPVWCVQIAYSNHFSHCEFTSLIQAENPIKTVTWHKNKPGKKEASLNVFFLLHSIFQALAVGSDYSNPWNQ